MALHFLTACFVPKTTPPAGASEVVLSPAEVIVPRQAMIQLSRWNYNAWKVSSVRLFEAVRTSLMEREGENLLSGTPQATVSLVGADEAALQVFYPGEKVSLTIALLELLDLSEKKDQEKVKEAGCFPSPLSFGFFEMTFALVREEDRRSTSGDSILQQGISDFLYRMESPLNIQTKDLRRIRFPGQAAPQKILSFSPSAVNIPEYVFEKYGFTGDGRLLIQP
jgi:hypothetical protein